MREKSRSFPVTSTQPDSRHDSASKTSFAKAVGDPGHLQPFLLCHFRQHVARAMPRAGPQFLSHDDAQVLEWCEGTMEALERLVGNRVAEGVDEELRIEFPPGGCARCPRWRDVPAIVTRT